MAVSIGLKKRICSKNVAKSGSVLIFILKKYVYKNSKPRNGVKRFFLSGRWPSTPNMIDKVWLDSSIKISDLSAYELHGGMTIKVSYLRSVWNAFNMIEPFRTIGNGSNINFAVDAT